jgi:hypothetical protein
MVVFAIILAGVGVLAGGIQRFDGAAWQRVDDTAEARTALEGLSRTIGRAVVPTRLGGTERAAFVQADPHVLVLYADLGDPGHARGPSLVELRVEDGVLTQTVRVPIAGTRDTYCQDDDTSPECAGRVVESVLARGVQSDGEPLFGYLDAAGAEVTDPRGVRSVRITLTVRTGSAGDAAVFVDDIVPTGLRDVR